MLLYHIDQAGISDVLTIGYGNDSHDIESTFLRREEGAIFMKIAVNGPVIWVDYASNGNGYDSELFLGVSEEERGKTSNSSFSFFFFFLSFFLCFFFLIENTTFFVL